MYLKKVTLKNFRCFEDLEIALHPRLTVLVAENGGGKTAILDAIAIGLSPLLRYLSSADQRLNAPGIKDNDFRLSADSQTPQASEQQLFPGMIAGPALKRRASERLLTSDFVQIVVEAGVGDKPLRWDNYRGASAGKQPDTKVGQGDLQSLASSFFEAWKTPTPKLLPVFAYYGARRGWLQIPERLRESKEDYSHPTSALLNALDSLSDFGEMLKWFDAEEASEFRANAGKPPEGHALSPALKAVRSAITALLGGAYVNPHFNPRHKFVVEPQSGPGELQVSQLSQGYQSMLALGMDFARRLAIGNSHLETVGDAFDWSFATRNMQGWDADELKAVAARGPSWAPAIMLVDEIDLHLHPSWQQRVLPDLMRAFPGTQFIVTTHSPQVLSTVGKDSIRLIQTVEGRSVLRTPEYQTRGVESADVLAAILEVDPSPKVPEAKWLDDYRAMIENATHDTQEGHELRTKLDRHFGEAHPVIRDCDRLIRFQTFKLRQPQPREG